MQKHVTAEDLLRFRDGTLPVAEVAAVGHHLAECERCAAFAGEMFRSDAVEALTGALTHGDEEEQAAPVAAGHGRRILQIAAATLLVLVGLGALLVVSQKRTRTKPITATGIAQRPQPPSGYERPEWNTLVRNALATGAVAVIAPANGTSNDVLRGATVTLGGPMSPAGTAVASPQPELTWPPVPHAQFVVTIAAGDEVVARSRRLDTNRWTPDRPLARGRTYEWQVRVLRGDRIDALPSPPQPAPRFRVITDDAMHDLDAARAAHPNDDLLLGVLSAHYGLRDDARRNLASYAAAHPSPEAQRLAGSVAMQ